MRRGGLSAQDRDQEKPKKSELSAMSFAAAESRYRHNNRSRETGGEHHGRIDQHRAGVRQTAGRVHPHNGYYAGDFGAVLQVAPAAWGAPIAAFDAELS